jgi:hypothetical protein
MAEKHFSILMVGGNARKSGKTSMICRLLGYYGKNYSIAAVKVALYDDREIFSAHYSEASESGYLEMKENNPDNKKDSGKFLSSGAMESWFIVAASGNEDRMLQKIMNIKDQIDWMILESNVMRKYIDPALFVMVNHGGKEMKASAKELSPFADLHVTTGSEIFENIESYIGIENDKWNIIHPL